MCSESDNLCSSITRTKMTNPSSRITKMIFERKIMRKIFGPTRTDDGYWRIKTNQEINYILKGQNIIGVIKKTKIKLVRPC